MNRSPGNSDRILENYRKLILRWNPQINLISRQDTANRLGALIGQCRDGWDMLVAKDSSGLATASRVWYFDLGSGGGFPGVVWHARMLDKGMPVQTMLVEPREKRAWFLGRVARLADPGSLLVAEQRWGEAPVVEVVAEAYEARPTHVLISLKALRLSDGAVLEGLAPFWGFSRNPAEKQSREMALKIARFYPSDQEWTETLATELDIPTTGQSRRVSSLLFRAEGGRVLTPTTPQGAALVLSEYRVHLP